MEPMEHTITGTNSLTAIAETIAAAHGATRQIDGQRTLAAADIRSALEALEPGERMVLERLLEERGVNAVAIDRILAAPKPELLRVPSLPFAQSERYQVLAASFTPRPGYTIERPTYPQGVAPHLDSHHDQLTQLIEDGQIPSEYASTLRLFIELHDRGYAGDTGVLQAKDIEDAQEEYLDTYRMLGATDDQAKRMLEYVLSGLRTEGNPVKQHLVGRVIGHAVNSVRYARKTLAEQGGMSQEQADALATLFATHHFGFPLTMVDGFAKGLGAEIPADLRPTFFVGGEEVTDSTLNISERRTESQDRADVLRAAVADRVAPILGISIEDERAIAAIAYALDRTTPARRMREFVLNDDGSFTWTGGETQKKYPLLIGDINAAINNPKVVNKPRRALRTVFDIASAQFGQERNAAIRTANNLGVTGLEGMIKEHSAREMLESIGVQRRAIAIADRLGVGSFATIDQDIAIVTEEYRRAKNEPKDGDDLDALGYLLGTLTVIQPRVKQVFPNG